MKTKFKKIQLGTRDLGLQTINIEGAVFEELPSSTSKGITKEPIWAEIDEANLKTLAYYFERISEGDMQEGLGEKGYYEVVGIKPSNSNSFEDINKAKQSYWHLEHNIPIQYENSTYLVRIN